MSSLEKICLVLLLCLTALAVLSYLPAVHPLHWFLRVGVPEIGFVLPLIALPMTLLLGRVAPKLAGLNYAILLTLILVPWVQAWAIASELPEQWSQTYASAPDRYPLRLASGGFHRKVTEEYQPGFSWDRYIPAERPTRARILFVHGGSWRNGTRQDYPELFEYLAGIGYEVLSVTYTLSGKAPYPAAPLDIETAIKKAHDPELPLFVAGRSSGGHLALLGAYTNPDLVRGVIGFYPPVDMKWSYDNPSNPRVLDSSEAIVEFMTVPPSEDPELYREASPIHRVQESGPATLLIHGGSDCLVFPRQSQMLSERLDELKVPNFVLSLPWMEHGGDVTIKGPTGRLSVWAIEGFMESLLTGDDQAEGILTE